MWRPFPSWLKLRKQGRLRQFRVRLLRHAGDFTALNARFPLYLRRQGAWYRLNLLEGAGLGLAYPSPQTTSRQWHLV